MHLRDYGHGYRRMLNDAKNEVKCVIELTIEGG